MADMKKKLKKYKAEQIGDGKSRTIINRGRMINDEKNMQMRKRTQKRMRKHMGD